MAQTPRRPSPANCPVCGETVATAAPNAPFCGERCRLVDLGRWFGESYSVPVETRRLAEELLADIDDDEPTE